MIWEYTQPQDLPAGHGGPGEISHSEDFTRHTKTSLKELRFRSLANLVQISISELSSSMEFGQSLFRFSEPLHFVNEALPSESELSKD